MVLTDLLIILPQNIRLYPKMSYIFTLWPKLLFFLA